MICSNVNQGRVMNKKFLSLLGFARKSGNLLIGFDNIKKKRFKAKLVISASDVSDRTEKNIKLLNIPLIETDMKKAEFGKLLGCYEISAVAVTDMNFASQLKFYAETEKE